MCAFIVRNIFDDIQPSTEVTPKMCGECFPHKNAASHAEGTVLTQQWKLFYTKFEYLNCNQTHAISW